MYICLIQDSIVLSLWNALSYGEGTLLAQGRLSFAMIKNHPIPARWLYFYGFHASEVASFTDKDWQLLEERGRNEGTAYIGRILIAARVTKVKSFDHLLPAEVVNARYATVGHG